MATIGKVWRSWLAVLRGDPAEVSGRALARTSVTLGVVSGAVANLAGAAVVGLLLLFVLPTPEGIDDRSVAIRNLGLGTVVGVGATIFGSARAIVHSRRTMRWLVADRDPTAEERDATLRLARWSAMEQGRLWLFGAVLFLLYNLSTSVVLAVEVAVTILVGGATTVAVAYLELERIGRAVVARALATHPPERRRGSGVAMRTLLAWGLGSGLPVVGIAALGAASLDEPVDSQQLALSAIVLSGLALGAGLLTMLLQVRSIAEPLSGLRDALARVEEGNLDVAVPVNDASEVGYLQAGFNRTVAGLRERERVRDLFGRHVGVDVAGRAIEGGVELGGEERDVGVLFVDVVASTAFAERTGPSEVVAVLNHFFGIVVDVTSAHGGMVNKFEGDAALCLWGAPLDHDDPAGGALRAARALGVALAESDLPVEATIGVSAGAVVAGNVGARDRFEYTVIGDPVNEAARLTGTAKAQDGRVVASGRAVQAALDGEGDCWETVGEEVLRGRSTPTVLFRPRAPEEPVR